MGEMKHTWSCITWKRKIGISWTLEILRFLNIFLCCKVMLLESMRAPCKPDKVPVTPRSSKWDLSSIFKLLPEFSSKFSTFLHPLQTTLCMNQSYSLSLYHIFKKRKKQTNKQNKTKTNKNKPNMIQFLTVIILSGVGMGNTQEIRKFVNNGSIFSREDPYQWVLYPPNIMKRCMGPGGGAFVFQTGYHPRKRTFKTHPKYVFFRYENRP